MRRKTEIKQWGNRRELTEGEVELINNRIKELGLRKDVVAKKARMTPDLFSRIIHNRRLVNEDEINRIAYALSLYSSVIIK